MRKRHSHHHSFVPATDRLEELARVSVLAPGALPEAAVAAVVAPPAPVMSEPIPDRSSDRVSPRIVVQSPALPTVYIAESSGEPAVLSTPVHPAVPKTEAVQVFASLLDDPADPAPIRPLSLSPALPQPPAAGPSPSPMPSAPAVAIGGMSPGGNGSGGGSSPASALSGNVGGSSANPGAMAGYVATGGSAVATPVALSSPGGGHVEDAGTGSGTGISSSSLSSFTGAFSGTTSGSVVGSSSTGVSSQTYTSQSGGTYSFPGYWQTGSGGDEYVPPVIGHIDISGGHDAIISGFQDLSVMCADVTVVPLSCSWSSSGAPIMLSDQTVPNPATSTTFTPIPYDISAQTTTNVSFYWGEKTGVETVTVSATVFLSGRGTATTAPVDLKIYVCSPGVSGKVIASDSASKGFNEKGGLAMQFGTDAQNGVDWGGISPTKGGQFKIVQIINGKTISVVPVEGRHLRLDGIYKVDASTTPPTFTAPLLPLVDVDTGSTTPFYAGTSDSPISTLLTYHDTTDSMSCTDYVMYSASNGKIWVPEGTFSWSYTAKATWTSGDFTVTASVVPTQGQLKVVIDHTAWPQAWNGLGGDYKGYKQTIV